MEPHRSTTSHSRSRDRAPEAPIDAGWIERKALAHAARWESTRDGVARVLERKIREHCRRTDSAPEHALALIPSILDRLVERNFVNDRRAAASLCERWRRQGRSTARIRLGLLEKGVPEPIALELTGDDDEVDLAAAWTIARKRRLGPHCADPERRRADRQRHLAVLARGGFSSEIAHRVIDAEPSTGAEGVVDDGHPAAGHAARTSDPDGSRDASGGEAT